jgi:hypothetical protein
MTIIQGNSVLCFAGDYYLGRDILSCMKESLAMGTHPELAWNMMRKRFSINNHSGVELIFEAMHPIGGGVVELISKSIGLPQIDEKFRSFEETIFAGSGAEHAKSVLAKSDYGPALEIEGKYERAVQRALHIVAELLDIDMRNGVSFDNHFGGFYEVAIWYGNKFKKIDGVQFVYWTIDDIVEDATSLTLDRIFLQYYQDDMLCVDEILIDNSTPRKISLNIEQYLPIANVLHHRIPPLSQGYHNQEFELSSNTNFQQKLTVHCCRIKDATGSTATATIVSGKIQSTHDNETIRINDSYVVLVKDIGRFLKDHLVSAMEGYRKML